MKTIDIAHKTVAISRTDSIGDVVLTLPICAWIKNNYPQTKIIFFCKSYTLEVLKCYPYIDKIVCVDQWEGASSQEKIAQLKTLSIHTFIHVFPNKELANFVKKAKIPYRIGTSHRWFHWLTCNIRPDFTRKNSNHHEAQLNFELLRTIGVEKLPSLTELATLISAFAPQEKLNPFLEEVLRNDYKKVVLHTKSQGSAVEWPIEKYIALSHQLLEKGYCVYFSGTEKEGQLFRSALPKHPQIIDVSGKSTVGELIAFLAQCDALVACSTGPLHLAAAVGIKAIGLYTDLRPMHPGRWAPIGKNTVALTLQNETNPTLEDINFISVEQVLAVLVNE